MSDIPNDQAPDPSQLVFQARQLLDDLQSYKTQAETHLKQAEISSKKADSEALLAFNAKKACEDHATTIANVKGTVEADANAIATNKQRSDEALAALTAAKAGIDADRTAIEGRRKEADQAAVAVEQSAQTIKSVAEASGTRLKDIDALKTSTESQAQAATDSAKTAAQASADSDAAHKRAVQSSADATALLATISEAHNLTSKLTEEMQALLTRAQVAEENLKQVLEHLTKSDEIASGHEKRVEALTANLQGLTERVEGLLPGATSAGLASSFNKQRSRFTGPQKQWLWTFIICIGLLFLVSLPTFFSAIGWGSHSIDQSWNAAWRSLAFRLPIMAPVIWLAIYAGRNYMMSLRMEEDYAYKEAISTAFEGYKREMEKIGASEGSNPTPITILCTNILRAIAERPGRIYEGKQQDINLLTEALNMLEKGTELSKKQLATH